MTDYEIVDLYADAPEDADLDEWLAQAGWKALFVLGEDSGLHVRTFQRRGDNGTWEYVADVWDAANGTPFVRVADFVKLMDLLARWAPAIQAATLADTLAEIRTGSLSYTGLVETVAAKAKHGVGHVHNQMVREERERAQRWEEQHWRRQSKQVDGRA